MDRVEYSNSWAGVKDSLTTEEKIRKFRIFCKRATIKKNLIVHELFPKWKRFELKEEVVSSILERTTRPPDWLTRIQQNVISRDIIVRHLTEHMASIFLLHKGYEMPPKCI